MVTESKNILSYTKTFMINIKLYEMFNNITKEINKKPDLPLTYFIKQIISKKINK